MYTSFSACSVIALAVSATAAHAQTHAFSVPAQKLESSLQTIGIQAHAEIIFLPEVVSGKTAPAIVGNFTVEGAIAKALSRSGLGFRPAGSGYLIIANPKAALASNAVQVNSDSAPAQAAPSAPEEAGSPIGDIVVTAQRRAERLQDVPISVSAFNAGMLESANVTTVFDLPRLAPSLQLDTGLQAAKARLVIRGIGSAGGSAIEPSVATFIDGVYIPREGATIGAYLDLEGLEVLRGPQGTLFGRNASVGALNLRSARPKDEFSGRIGVEGGTGERYRAEGFINVPLADGAALRFAGFGESFGGLYRNLLDGERVGGADSFATRLTGAFDISPQLSWVVRLNYAGKKGDAFAPYALLPESFPQGQLPVYLARFAAIGSTQVDLDPFDRTINQYVGDHMDDSQWGINSTLNMETGSGFTFRLINAYQDWTNDQVGTGAFSAEIPTLTQFVGWDSESHSHEFQIISPQNTLLGGAFDFVAGLYYMNETYRSYEAFLYNTGMCNLVFVNLPAAAYNSCINTADQREFDQNFVQETNSFAAYGQATVRFAPALDLVLGARWTRDEKSASIRQDVYSVIGAGAATNEDRGYEIANSRPTWRANLNWRPTPDFLFFASFATGYKSGGVNSQTSPTLVNRVFLPETVENYEIGAKTEWFDRRLQVNATIYRMDVKNFQDRSYNGVNFSLQNAGDIRNQGVELDMIARPIEGLRLNVSLSYLDSVFTSYPGASNLPGMAGIRDISGSRPAFAPEWAGAVGAEYRTGIGTSPYSLMLRADMSFLSDTNIGYINDNNPQTVQKAYQLTSARAVFYGPDDRWSVYAFANNLFDVGYCTSLPYQPFGSLIGAVANGQSALRCNTVGQPRTVGVGAKVDF